MALDIEIEAAKKQRQQIIALIVSLLAILILVLLLAREMTQVRAFISESGWIGLVVSVLIYAILGASPIPSEPLTVLLSTVYGPFAATMVSGMGNLLAALIEYFIGERIGGAAGFEARRAKLPFGLGKLPVDSPLFLIAARMLPGYGPKFVSLLGGIYRVPMYRYLWTAALPTFLGSAIFAYGGFGLFQLGIGE
jgi:uncharacterized membrane protein YdjX (TVP38/TMEM64 family)